MAAILKKAFPRGKVLNGSRDYLQITRGGYVFELVPVLAIGDWQEAQNSMDMSVFHVTYVSAHLSAAQKEDARLAKQFCKAAGIYGAESYTRGFSGYVLELLVHHYGSFEKLLRASRRWSAPLVIDTEKHYKSVEQALRHLNEAKLLAPIILIDPVQPERNAAAGLSDAAFQTFKARADAFLKKPHKSFFESTYTKARIKKEVPRGKLFIVEPKTPKGKQDVVGCKILAKHEAARKLLKENDFILLHADWRFGENKSLCWYVLNTDTLPKMREQQGPPSHMKEAVIGFKAKHPKAFERNGRWVAPVKRPINSAKAILKKVWGQS